jgi:hypothetical protein
LEFCFCFVLVFVVVVLFCFAVLGLKLRDYTLSHYTLFLWWVFSS